ncbi:MAG: PAS domain S-box protein [Geobacteraceae bacterium]|nr:PAS domain S-box protein [Geobacteraceae bacterium]
MEASDYQKIRHLFDDYLQMYASRDDRLTTYFSDDFSGFTGGGDVLVKDREAWVAITRQDFAQVKDPIRIELKDLAIQSLSDTIAVTTGFFVIHLPIEDHILSRETARLVLIFRKESAGWKISHSSISIPYYLVREGEVYPLQELVERNQLLEEQIAERTRQLSEINDQLEQEIEGHKQIEDTLRLSEEKFSTAFRVSPDAVTITRLNDGRYLEVNDGFTALSGYTSTDAVGRTSLDLNIWVDPDDRRRLAGELKRHGVVTGLEAQFRRKDGSTLTGLMSARVIEVGDGACLLSITRDISERKRAEERLQENERTIRTLMDSMPAGVWWFNNEGAIEYVNRCFIELFGYTLDDIPTLEAWYERAYPDPGYREPYIAARNSLIDKAWDSDTLVPPRETKITCKDGSQRHIIINTQFVLGRKVEIFTDITTRELVHDQLQRIGKLESLGVLAGGIAHDFNNILTGIIGNISFARTFLDASHKSASILSNAEKAANRAAHLAHQLLTFAKGGQPVKKIASLQHILEESASFVLRGSNVTSDIALPANLPSVEVDEGQISQVFNNIIINATHAMPGGGTITIRAESVTLAATNLQSLTPGHYIRLTLSDTGCGITEEIQKKIFDPYFTTKSSGSGLGLASAHSIIVRHGGHIGVSSVTGRGTTFTIYLPSSSATSAEELAGSPAHSAALHTGGTILVMDDEELILEMAADMLAYLGYGAMPCRHGSEALTLYTAAMAAGTPFSAVILDLTIPGGMGGKETAQRILAIDPGACLIVSSGYSNDPIMASYRSYGFSAALAKPYNLQELGEKLSSALSRRPPAVSG